jgi:hypothetical protein
MADKEEGPTVKDKPGPSKLSIYTTTIHDGHGNGPVDTGIYFPDAYSPGSSLDLLVYFHGLADRCDGDGRPGIRSLWENANFPLRKLVNDSKKNVVLVAPRLQLDDGLSLGMDPEPFLNKVVALIAKRVTKDPFAWHGAAPTSGPNVDPVITIRKLILAAHSGGGSPMRRMARALVNSKVATVRECWGFDSMYNGPKEWVEWAAAGGKYFLFYTDQGSIDTETYGYNVRAIQKILAKANDASSGVVQTIAHVFANSLAQAKAGSRAKQAQVRKEQEKRDHETASAALAAPNIIVTYANDPGNAAKGFTPPSGRAFDKSTPKHCKVPQTYWADMMGSF